VYNLFEQKYVFQSFRRGYGLCGLGSWLRRARRSGYCPRGGRLSLQVGAPQSAVEPYKQALSRKLAQAAQVTLATKAMPYLCFSPCEARERLDLVEQVLSSDAAALGELLSKNGRARRQARRRRASAGRDGPVGTGGLLDRRAEPSWTAAYM
jgi:hypothetical protein